MKPEEIARVRRELGIQEGDTALCFVGRLGKEKSIDVMIDYFSRHFKGQLSYKLFIIGDGPERKALQQQIDRLGVQQQVHLLGRIEHELLPPYYHACDLFCTASLSEMNSISMLEAMASGLYVVQRLDVYNKDQIAPGVNGNLFTTSEEMAALLREEGEMDAAARQQRRNGVTAYTKRYGREEFMRRILNIYDRAIDKYQRLYLKKR